MSDTINPSFVDQQNQNPTANVNVDGDSIPNLNNVDNTTTYQEQEKGDTSFPIQNSSSANTDGANPPPVAPVQPQIEPPSNPTTFESQPPQGDYMMNTNFAPTGAPSFEGLYGRNDSAPHSTDMMTRLALDSNPSQPPEVNYTSNVAQNQFPIYASDANTVASQFMMNFTNPSSMASYPTSSSLGTYFLSQNQNGQQFFPQNQNFLPTDLQSITNPQSTPFTMDMSFFSQNMNSQQPSFPMEQSDPKSTPTGMDNPQSVYLSTVPPTTTPDSSSTNPSGMNTNFLSLHSNPPPQTNPVTSPPPPYAPFGTAGPTGSYLPMDSMPFSTDQYSTAGNMFSSDVSGQNATNYASSLGFNPTGTFNPAYFGLPSYIVPNGQGGWGGYDLYNQTIMGNDQMNNLLMPMGMGMMGVMPNNLNIGMGGLLGVNQNMNNPAMGQNINQTINPTLNSTLSPSLNPSINPPISQQQNIPPSNPVRMYDFGQISKDSLMGNQNPYSNIDKTAEQFSQLTDAFVNLLPKAKERPERFATLDSILHLQPDQLTQFVNKKGVTHLKDWSEKARADKDWEMIDKILDVLYKLPVTIEVLKETEIGKFCGTLSKSGSLGKTATHAKQVVDKWRESLIPKPAKTEGSANSAAPSATNQNATQPSPQPPSPAQSKPPTPPPVRTGTSAPSTTQTNPTASPVQTKPKITPATVKPNPIEKPLIDKKMLPQTKITDKSTVVIKAPSIATNPQKKKTPNVTPPVTSIVNVSISSIEQESKKRQVPGQMKIFPNAPPLKRPKTDLKTLVTPIPPQTVPVTQSPQPQPQPQLQQITPQMHQQQLEQRKQLLQLQQEQQEKQLELQRQNQLANEARKKKLLEAERQKLLEAERMKEREKEMELERERLEKERQERERLEALEKEKESEKAPLDPKLAEAEVEPPLQTEEESKPKARKRVSWVSDDKLVTVKYFRKDSGLQPALKNNKQGQAKERDHRAQVAKYDVQEWLHRCNEIVPTIPWSKPEMYTFGGDFVQKEVPVSERAKQQEEYNRTELLDTYLKDSDIPVTPKDKAEKPKPAQSSDVKVPIIPFVEEGKEEEHGSLPSPTSLSPSPQVPPMPSSSPSPGGGDQIDKIRSMLATLMAGGFSAAPANSPAFPPNNFNFGRGGFSPNPNGPMGNMNGRMGMNPNSNPNYGNSLPGYFPQGSYEDPYSNTSNHNAHSGWRNEEGRGHTSERPGNSRGRRGGGTSSSSGRDARDTQVRREGGRNGNAPSKTNNKNQKRR